MHAPPRRRLPGELAFVVVMLLLGAIALWQAARISGFSGWSTPGAVPMLAAAVMVLAGLKVVRDTRRMRRPELEGDETNARSFVRQVVPARIVWFTLLIAGYMLLLEPLGFVVCSFLFLVGAMFALGERRLLRTVAISAVSLALIYVVFQTAFSVVLPEGLLKGLL
jgi:putative tricarboxylic transport membrane protein